MKKCIVWLRKDLRLQDHPGFVAAIENGYAVIPFYLWDESDHEWAEGGASQWWLHHALQDISAQLVTIGDRIGHEISGGLRVETGSALEVIPALVDEWGVDAVYWGRRYEPEIIQRDTTLKTKLKEMEIEVKSFNTHVLLEPHTVQNKSGSFFKVFTPYWKHCRGLEITSGIDPDWSKAIFADEATGGKSISDLALLPEISWDQEFYTSWDPTRAGGMQRLDAMKKEKAIVYQKFRDFPAVDGTSRLSPWLQWGQISAREIYHQLKDSSEIVHLGYLRQLFWREFSYHLLYHVPHSTERALRPEFEQFPWKRNQQFISAWQKGMTGFPIVDAGMRQLWQTGWMHNRVRMIVGSFLVKHLLQDWREGASWFWDTLVDADLANNTMGWQWIAGSGADAAPYFRIFNPIIQGEKFDKSGEYVRHWCPELKNVPNKFIHRLWDMPELELRAAGVVLGKDYPAPIVSHEEGRKSALDAYAEFKEQR